MPGVGAPLAYPSARHWSAQRAVKHNSQHFRTKITVCTWCCFHVAHRSGLSITNGPICYCLWGYICKACILFSHAILPQCLLRHVEGQDQKWGHLKRTAWLVILKYVARLVVSLVFLSVVYRKTFSVVNWTQVLEVRVDLLCCRDVVKRVPPEKNLFFQW